MNMIMENCGDAAMMSSTEETSKEEEGFEDLLTAYKENEFKMVILVREVGLFSFLSSHLCWETRIWE